MPLSNFKQIEIPEWMLPSVFILFALKFSFFDVFTQSYQFASFLPEYVWAIIFVVIGILQLSATVSRLYKFRLTMLFISASIWLFWASFIIVYGSKGFGDIIWTSIAVSTFWTYYRLKYSPFKQ